MRMLIVSQSQWIGLVKVRSSCMGGFGHLYKGRENHLHFCICVCTFVFSCFPFLSLSLYHSLYPLFPLYIFPAELPFILSLIYSLCLIYLLIIFCSFGLLFFLLLFFPSLHPIIQSAFSIEKQRKQMRVTIQARLISHLSTVALYLTCFWSQCTSAQSHSLTRVGFFSCTRNLTQTECCYLTSPKAIWQHMTHSVRGQLS